MTITGITRATKSTDPPVSTPGSVRAVVAAGPILMERDLTWDLEYSFKAGIVPALELAAPLALGIRVIDAGPGSGVCLGIGVVDLLVTPKKRVLYSPAIVLFGQARIGSGSALRAAVDLKGLEDGFKSEDHPGWLRGSFGLVIDFGPWVTLGAGFSFQRLIFGHQAPEGSPRTGWVGNSRFSVGAVRTQPFSPLPTLSIHITRFLSIVALLRFSYDTDTNTAENRWLLGLEFTN